VSRREAAMCASWLPARAPTPTSGRSAILIRRRLAWACGCGRSSRVRRASERSRATCALAVRSRFRGSRTDRSRTHSSPARSTGPLRAIWSRTIPRADRRYGLVVPILLVRPPCGRRQGVPCRRSSRGRSHAAWHRRRPVQRPAFGGSRRTTGSCATDGPPAWRRSFGRLPRTGARRERDCVVEGRDAGHR